MYVHYTAFRSTISFVPFSPSILIAKCSCYLHRLQEEDANDETETRKGYSRKWKKGKEKRQEKNEEEILRKRRETAAKKGEVEGRGLGCSCNVNNTPLGRDRLAHPYYPVTIYLLFVPRFRFVATLAIGRECLPWRRSGNRSSPPFGSSYFLDIHEISDSDPPTVCQKDQRNSICVEPRNLILRRNNFISIQMCFEICKCRNRSVAYLIWTIMRELLICKEMWSNDTIGNKSKLKITKLTNVSLNTTLNA